MEVAPDIFLLRVPIADSYLGFLNAYLVRSPEGSLLIDTGWNTDEAFGALARQLGDAGVSLSDLKYIAITHAHPDHFGLLGRLRDHTHAQWVMHEIELTYLTTRYVDYDSLLNEQEQWLRINGVPDASRDSLKEASLPVLDRVSIPHIDCPVRGGEHLRFGDFDFEIVWTPGHSQGHICFYEAKRRILVTGDHVLPGITPNIAFHTQSMGNPLVDYLDSLEAVEELDVDLVLPSHKEPFRDLRKRAQEIREHHELREGHVLAAFNGATGSDLKNAYQIASLIPWATKGVPWEELAPLSKRSAVMETLSHLEYLRARGELRKRAKDGLLWYAPRRRED